MTPAARDRGIAARVTAMVAAPMIATAAGLLGDDDRVLAHATPALISGWLVMACALATRVVREARRPGATRAEAWAHLDVLTATGGSVLWAAALALVGAALTGWASLGVVGVLGLGAVYLAVAWTALAAGGDAPWRGATITRAILPEVCSEGDALREELQLDHVAIPPGMRLFVSGRALPHGLTTRYTVGARGARAQLQLHRALGAAVRGAHQAPPLRLWLGDVLGLTRTPTVHRGEARFSVLPRPVTVTGVRALLGPGGDDLSSELALRQPTEGTFRIRDYAPGDDTRRIHWVRSLQAQQLVVRLPDELPPADPVVRLVLDNELRGTEALSCAAPHELLDALVRVWLGVGRALSEAGTRVVLVTAAEHGGAIAVVERPMNGPMSGSMTGTPGSTSAQVPRACLQLGGRVAWQAEVTLARLLARAPVRHIVVSSRPRALVPDRPAEEITWIVLPEHAWTRPDREPRAADKLRLPYPAGSADNRRERRRRERRRLESMRQDHAVFSQIICWTDWAAFSGHHLARPSRAGVELAVIP